MSASTTITDHQSKLFEFLDSIKTQSPLFPNNFGNVLTVEKDAPLSEAFQKLIEHRILSIPVVDTDGKLLSLLTLKDLVCYIVVTFTDDDFKGRKFSEMLAKKEEFQKKKVADVKDSIETMHTIDAAETVLAAVKLMINKNAHRVVVTEEGKPKNLITQSRILKLVSVLLDALPIKGKTVQQLKLGLKPVVTISHKSSARQAFKLMVEKHVSATAVVDDKGALCGNLSVRDIKEIGFQAEYFEWFNEEIKVYLNNIRLMDRNRNIPEGQDPVRVTLNTTFEGVVKALTFYNIHRIYVVDSDNRPIGVISIGDVMSRLFAA